jgi:Na+/H+ antiporter NhaD/arsenite permease-like protein
VGIAGLALIVAGVFIDPLLSGVAWLHHFPVGATFQIAVAAGTYLLSDGELYRGNEFSFFPVKEVGLLFLGIFTTMVPALGYLAAHGPSLDIRTPTQFYFLTGGLSAVLDNAPTYMNFVQLALGDAALTPEAVRAQLLTGDGARALAAISTGAVFFGGMTYIGNGPNFMVRSIAESTGVKMPSFLGYFARALAILLPVLMLHWLIAVR